MYEVAAGKIASEKGQSEAVKRSAGIWSRRTAKRPRQLKGIVQAEKIEVELPAEVQ